MSKRSQEKRRARSKEKKLAKRRQLAAGPLGRLAGTAEAACECWMHYAQDDDRTRNMIVIRPLRNAGYLAAFFLIDFDCLGLKDVFWRDDIDPAALRETMRRRSQEENTTFSQISLSQARQTIAGAMRWTQANPFHLPPRTLRAITVLGEPLDVGNAPIDEFGTEKGFLYVGREEDLAKALRGITLDEFLDRDDVEYEFVGGGQVQDFDDDEDFEEDFDDEELDEDSERVVAIAEDMVQSCIAEVKRDCNAKGVQPSPLLETVARIYVGSVLAQVAAVEQSADDEQAKTKGTDMMLDLFAQQNADPEDLMHAFKQITNCGHTHPDSLVNAALGRVKSRPSDMIDVPLSATSRTESSCSTPATPNSPTS